MIRILAVLLAALVCRRACPRTGAIRSAEHARARNHQGQCGDPAAQRHRAGTCRADQAAGARRLLQQRAVPSRHPRLHGADRRRRSRRRHAASRNIRTSRPSSRRCRSSAAWSAWRAPAIPNSANCQFFITYADAPHLNGQYTVIGEVVSGMDNVDKIKKGEPVADPDRITRAFVQADAQEIQENRRWQPIPKTR